MAVKTLQQLAKVSATPKKLPAWFEPYTQWRFVGLPYPAARKTFPRPKFPRHITTKEYGWVLDEWDRFPLWDTWLLSGKKGKRPIGLWLSPNGKPVSPGWAVRTRRLVEKFRKTPVPVPAPIPPPPHSYDVSLGFSWIVMAQQPNNCLMYPPYYNVMFTADSAYEKPSASLIQQLKDRGSRVWSWCDCHSTFPDTAMKMASDLGLGGWCGEGESSGAFQTAMDAGAELIIVNLTALTPDQKEKYLRPRKTVAINELYLNQDASRATRENWEGLPIAGRLAACYDAASEASTGRYFSMPEYFAINKYSGHHDSFYDPGAKDVDRKLVP
jgi:hypothetical protein